MVVWGGMVGRAPHVIAVGLEGSRGVASLHVALICLRLFIIAFAVRATFLHFAGWTPLRFAGAFLIGVAIVLMVFGASVTWTSYMRGAFKPTTLEIPTWIMLLIIPIGCALLAARFLRETIVSADAIATGRDVKRGEQPPPSVE